MCGGSTHSAALRSRVISRDLAQCPDVCIGLEDARAAIRTTAVIEHANEFTGSEVRTGHPICAGPLWTGRCLVWTDIDTHSLTHSGTIGFISCWWFVWTIYGAVKVD